MNCVYVSIGQKDSKLRKLETRLREGGAMEYTTSFLPEHQTLPRSHTSHHMQEFLSPNSSWTRAKMY